MAELPKHRANGIKGLVLGVGQDRTARF